MKGELPIVFDGKTLNDYCTPLFDADVLLLPETEDTYLMNKFSERKFGKRVIRIPCILKFSSEKKRQELSAILSVKEPKKLIMGRSPDRYYMAIPDGNISVGFGKYQNTFDMQFICNDHRAYALATKTFPASLNSDGILEATIVNNGTADVPISYEITHNADNGYIGIVSAEGAMEFGKRDELDGEDYQESDLLINATKTFEEFLPDAGPNATNINFATNGELATKEADGRNVLYLKDAGSGDYWHGGQVTCTLPADSQGGIGADKFYVYFNAVFQTGLLSQTGLFTLSFLDEDDKNICSYTVTKHITNANLAQAQFWVGDKCYKTVDFYPTMWNKDNQFAAETGHCSITKNGDYFEFYWRKAYNFGVHVPEMADKKCVKVQIYLAQLRDRTLSEADFLGRLYFRELSFMKLNVDKWRNVPNRYAAGDVFSIDGETKKPYLNGMTALDDEVVGTNYFKAPPGTSKVQFYFSGFSDPLPAVTAKIREAWL